MCAVTSAQLFLNGLTRAVRFVSVRTHIVTMVCNVGVGVAITLGMLLNPAAIHALGGGEMCQIFL